MRMRFWMLIAVAALAIVLAGCGAARISRGPANTPIPTKTLRPTFTATVPKPTLTPSPTAAAASQPVAGDQAPAGPAATEAPTATAEPPTAEPSPTPEPAAFTVDSATLNVRSGPSTAFAVIGRLSNSQSFPITGKNNDGSWWQFDYNGRTGWVAGSNVSVRSGDTVQVAQNIPAAPTAAPRPTARPAAPVPAQPKPQPQPQPQVTVKYSLTKSELRPNSNPIISVWCFVLNPGGNGVVGGTIRVLQGGATVKEQPFNAVMARGDPGYSSEYLYNDGCKVELPAADGTYSAYLIEGGAQVSDVYNFTVSGETNRIAIVEWKQR